MIKQDTLGFYSYMTEGKTHFVKVLFDNLSKGDIVNGCVVTKVFGRNAIIQKTNYAERISYINGEWRGAGNPDEKLNIERVVWSNPF